jgi:hypothetical protein
MMSVYKQVLCFVQYLVEKIGLLRWLGNSVSMTAILGTTTSVVGTEPSLTTIVRLPNSGQLRMHTKSPEDTVKDVAMNGRFSLKQLFIAVIFLHACLHVYNLYIPVCCSTLTR